MWRSTSSGEMPGRLGRDPHRGDACGQQLLDARRDAARGRPVRRDVRRHDGLVGHRLEGAHRRPASAVCRVLAVGGAGRLARRRAGRRLGGAWSVRAPERATALRVGTALATGCGRCLPLAVGRRRGARRRRAAARRGAAGVASPGRGGCRRAPAAEASRGVLRRLARSPDARAAPAARAPFGTALAAFAGFLSAPSPGLPRPRDALRSRPSVVPPCSPHVADRAGGAPAAPVTADPKTPPPGSPSRPPARSPRRPPGSCRPARSPAPHASAGCPARGRRRGTGSGRC